MLNVLESILGFFEMLVNLIVNLVTGIFSIITLIPQASTLVNASIAYMPSVLSVFAYAGIALCIVLFIIGR